MCWKRPYDMGLSKNCNFRANVERLGFVAGNKAVASLYPRIFV